MMVEAKLSMAKRQLSAGQEAFATSIRCWTTFMAAKVALCWTALVQGQVH
jgi:hypothetical protein